MVWPFSRLLTSRTDGTVTLGNLAPDVNRANQALNQTLDIIGTAPTGPFEAGGTTYATIQAVLQYLYDANKSVSGKVDDTTKFARIRSGGRNPTASDGNLNDFWINSDVWTIYGPKVADSGTNNGGWGTATSIIGPRGIQGPQGIQGEPGSTVLPDFVAWGGMVAPPASLGEDGDVYTQVSGLGVGHYYRENGKWRGPMYEMGNGPGTETAAPTLAYKSVSVRTITMTIGDTIAGRSYILYVNNTKTSTEYAAPGDVTYTAPTGQDALSLQIKALDPNGRESLLSTPPVDVVLNPDGGLATGPHLNVTNEGLTADAVTYWVSFQMPPAPDASYTHIHLFRDGAFATEATAGDLDFAINGVLDPRTAGSAPSGLTGGATHTWKARWAKGPYADNPAFGPWSQDVKYKVGSKLFSRGLSIRDTDVSQPFGAPADARTVAMNILGGAFAAGQHVQLFRDGTLVKNISEAGTNSEWVNQVANDGDPNAAGTVGTPPYLLLGESHTWQVALADAAHDAVGVNVGPKGAPLTFTVGQV